LLAALHGLQENLVFKKTTVEEALDLILEKHGKSWGRMTETERIDWKETLTRRLRNLCRAVSQGECKTRNATWVKALPWHAANGTEEPGIAAKPEAANLETTPPPQKRSRMSPTTAGDEFKFGFDNEVMLPYRTQGNGTPETGLPLTADAAVQDGWLVAEWPDGMTAPIEGMTAERFRGLVAARSARPSGNGELWSGTHCSSKNHVCLKQKVDHWLLIVAYEQSRNLVSARLHTWGKIDDEREQVPPSHPACVGGVAFMKKLMERYCSGELEQGQLQQAKNEMLKAAGFKTPANSSMKRPAAATATDYTKEVGDTPVTPEATVHVQETTAEPKGKKTAKAKQTLSMKRPAAANDRAPAPAANEDVAKKPKQPKAKVKVAMKDTAKSAPVAKKQKKPKAKVKVAKKKPKKKAKSAGVAKPPKAKVKVAKKKLQKKAKSAPTVDTTSDHPAAAPTVDTTSDHPAAGQSQMTTAARQVFSLFEDMPLPVASIMDSLV